MRGRIAVLHAGLALALLLGVTMLVAPASARMTLAVAPSLIELSGAPGSSGSQEIRVYNEGDEPFDVVATIGPYKGASGDWSAESWLTVSPERLHLEPGEDGAVTVEIAIPEEGAPGGRFASLFITTAAPDAPQDGTALALAGQVGVPFLITVEGDEPLEPAATLREFYAVLQPDGQYGFRTLLANEGQVHLFAEQGKLEVATSEGELIGTLDFGGTTAILPEMAEQVVAQGALPLEPDTAYAMTTRMTYGEDGEATAENRFTTTPMLVIDEVAVCVNDDRGPTISVAIGNSGTVAVAPAITAKVTGAEGQELTTANPGSYPLSLPGESIEVQIQYPSRLLSGEYELAVSVQAGTETALTKNLPFRIGGLVEGATPACEA